MGSAVNQAPGGCNCGECLALFEVYPPLGQSMRPPEATVTVWRDDTKAELLDSGEVDSNGQIALLVGSAGDVYVEVTAPRYQDYAATVNVASCGATVQIYLAVHPNYVGVAAGSGLGCRYPVPKTLHFSASGGASGTLTYQGPSGTSLRWQGAVPTSYAGAGSCPAGTVNVRYNLDFASLSAISAPPTMTRIVPLKITRSPSPPFPVISSCPDSSGGDSAGGTPMILDTLSFSCYPLYAEYTPNLPNSYPWADQDLEVTE